MNSALWARRVTSSSLSKIQRSLPYECSNMTISHLLRFNRSVDTDSGLIAWLVAVLQGHPESLAATTQEVMQGRSIVSDSRPSTPGAPGWSAYATLELTRYTRRSAFLLADSDE